MPRVRYTNREEIPERDMFAREKEREEKEKKREREERERLKTHRKPQAVPSPCS